MTPEQAETIYYREYGKGKWQEPEKPLVQKELRMKAWQAVIDAVEAEYARKMAQQMLSGISADASVSLPGNSAGSPRSAR